MTTTRVRTDGAKSYYYHRETASSSQRPNMLYQHQSRARVLSRNYGTHGLAHRSPRSTRAPQKDLRLRGRRRCSSSREDGMPRVSISGSQATNRKRLETSRSNNVDLTCTLPEDETPSCRPRSSRVREKHYWSRGRKRIIERLSSSRAQSQTVSGRVR